MKKFLRYNALTVTFFLLHVTASQAQLQPSSQMVGSSAASTKWTIAPEILRAKRHVVVIQSEVLDDATKRYQPARTGTGFYGPNGVIITNAHMRLTWITDISAGGLMSQKVTGIVDRLVADGQIATVIAADAKNDIMVLGIPHPSVMDYSLEWETEVTQTEPVIQIGNPGGLEKSVNYGTVTNITPDCLVIDAQTIPGNSGSLLLNRYGKIIAMTRAKYPAVQIDRMAFGVWAKDILKVLDFVEKSGSYDKWKDPHWKTIELNN